jgi:hypothetical protein
MLRIAGGALEKGFLKTLEKKREKKKKGYIWKGLNSRYMTYIYGL